MLCYHRGFFKLSRGFKTWSNIFSLFLATPPKISCLPIMHNYSSLFYHTWKFALVHVVLSLPGMLSPSHSLKSDQTWPSLTIHPRTPKWNKSSLTQCVLMISLSLSLSLCVSLPLSYPSTCLSHCCNCFFIYLFSIWNVRFLRAISSGVYLLC